MISGGNGYLAAPTVTITGGGGSGATATANLNGGVVSSLTPTSAGTGYSSVPTVTISSPPPNITYATYWSNDGTSVNGSEPAAAVSVNVTNGLFTVVLGDTTLPNMTAISAALFSQPGLQLRIWFNDGTHGFAVLNPVQNITPTPYAIQALNAATATTATTATSANSVAAANIVGMLALSQLQGAVVTNNQAGVNLTGSFSGNGGSLTNLSPNSLVLVSTNIGITSWGDNTYGQRTIPTGLNNAIALAAGTAHSLALKSDGTVVAWGAGLTNNPSNGHDFGQSIVPAGLSNVTAVAAGYLHSLALESNGMVVAWGAGLTNNPTDNADYGQSIVPVGLTNVMAVAAGFAHSLALKSNGTVVAWGAGQTNTFSIDSGQSIVPAGRRSNIASPLRRAQFIDLALKSNGTVVAWGAGTSNNPSDGLDFGQSIVPAGLTNVVAISAGVFHSLALKSNGTVVAWGEGASNNPADSNDFGQSMVPPGLSNVVAVVAGFYHSLALKADGTVVAWGDGASGTTNVPVGLDNVVALAPGSCAQHVLAFRKVSTAPVAWLDSDNTFNGSIQINGDANVSGELTAGNGLRLNDGNMWLRKGNDQNSGLGWYGTGKTFASQTPDGPVLFGNSGGALASANATNGQQIALAWNASQQVGIGTVTPTARLDLGSDAANTKLLLYDGNNSMGIGANGSRFMFNLGGDGGSFSFMDAPGGNELVTITTYPNGLGYIGIGTTTPNNRLDVRGLISLGSSGQYLAVGAKESLFIIRGHVNAF